MMPVETPWMDQASYPLLATLQWLPLLAMLLALLLRRSHKLFPVAIILGAAELLLSVHLYQVFDQGRAGMQLAEHLPLLPFLSYHAAADGMTVLFMMLSSLLCFALLLYTRVRRVARAARFIAAIFAIEAALQGLFATQDLLWFLLMSAVELIVIAYLLRGWANAPQEDLAMQRYLQFMGTGLLLLLGGIFMLGWNYAGIHGSWTFDLHELVTVQVPVEIQSVIFFLLFYGLAIRIPLFPLHGWLPLIAEHGTVAVAGVFLLGLKTGVYGLIRFVFPLLPEAVVYWQHWVVAFAVAGIFYAALLALMQTNLRRLLAFAVVSHTSVLVIGLFSLNHIALQGSVILSVNFGLATSILLFMSGFVFRRTRTLNLNRLGGLFDRLPIIGIAFFIAGLSIIGMPGTPGFDAVHLVLEAAIGRFGALVTIAAALGNVAAAAFLLYAFQRAFLAQRDDSLPELVVERATAMERIMAVGMCLILLGAGFFSEPWLELVDLSFESVTTQFARLDGGH